MQSQISNRQSAIENASPLPCFIRPLRDAIRRGDKTETRRVLHPQPTNKIADAYMLWNLWGNQLSLANNLVLEPEVEQEWTLTQANIGALYYLREPLKNVNGWMFYADDDEPVSTPKGAREWKRINGRKLQRNSLPQIHMPAAAARTFVRLTKVWVERLHNITEAAALAEGISRIGKASPSLYQPPGNIYAGNNERLGPICGSAKVAFQHLWDAINAKRDDGQWAWKNNPFVIVRQFTLEK